MMRVDAPQATTGDVAAEELVNASPEDIAEDANSTHGIDGQEAPMKLLTNLGPHCRETQQDAFTEPAMVFCMRPGSRQGRQALAGKSERSAK